MVNRILSRKCSFLILSFLYLRHSVIKCQTSIKKNSATGYWESTRFPDCGVYLWPVLGYKEWVCPCSRFVAYTFDRYGGIKDENAHVNDLCVKMTGVGLVSPFSFVSIVSHRAGNFRTLIAERTDTLCCH